MNVNRTEATQSEQAMVNGFIERLPCFIIAAVVFVSFAFPGQAVRKGIRALTARTRKHRNIGLVLGRIGYGIILFIGLPVALVIAIPGFTPGQPVNLLGLSSVAIGFAFRDIVQNFLAGRGMPASICRNRYERLAAGSGAGNTCSPQEGAGIVAPQRARRDIG